MLLNSINVDIMVDYYEEVRRNMQAAADYKAAERKKEARQTRWAKILVIVLLLATIAVVAICNNYIPG